jgi:hypothetical protein
MTSMHEDSDRALTHDLAALRAAMRDVRAPADGEVALRAALWVRRHAAPTPPRARHRARTAALAAAAALGAIAVSSLLLRTGSRDPGALDGTAGESARPLAPPAELATTAFQPLAFTPALSASQSYSVVRVRIPLAALAPGHVGPTDATIEADLLVGEDGLARGIRFDSADTLFVAAR